MSDLPLSGAEVASVEIARGTHGRATGTMRERVIHGARESYRAGRAKEAFSMMREGKTVIPRVDAKTRADQVVQEDTYNPTTKKREISPHQKARGKQLSQTVVGLYELSEKGFDGYAPGIDRVDKKVFRDHLQQYFISNPAFHAYFESIGVDISTPAKLETQCRNLAQAVLKNPLVIERLPAELVDLLDGAAVNYASLNGLLDELQQAEETIASIDIPKIDGDITKLETDLAEYGSKRDSSSKKLVVGSERQRLMDLQLEIDGANASIDKYNRAIRDVQRQRATVISGGSIKPTDPETGALLTIDSITDLDDKLSDWQSTVTKARGEQVARQEEIETIQAEKQRLQEELEAKKTEKSEKQTQLEEAERTKKQKTAEIADARAEVETQTQTLVDRANGVIQNIFLDVIDESRGKASEVETEKQTQLEGDLLTAGKDKLRVSIYDDVRGRMRKERLEDEIKYLVDLGVEQWAYVRLQGMRGQGYDDVIDRIQGNPAELRRWGEQLSGEMLVFASTRAPKMLEGLLTADQAAMMAITEDVLPTILERAQQDNSARQQVERLINSKLAKDEKGRLQQLRSKIEPMLRSKAGIYILIALLAVIGIGGVMVLK